MEFEKFTNQFKYKFLLPYKFKKKDKKNGDFKFQIDLKKKPRGLETKTYL